jgi:hypothetical protein
MLEKKKGVRRIHMLRIIALLEADFNTALKILFAKRLMDNAESVGLNEEQWGSRRNRMALDPAMKNLIQSSEKMCFGEKCVSAFSHWAETQT